MILFAKWITAVAFSVCALSSAVAQAECNDCEHTKIYLAPGSLSMDTSRLYVNFRGELYPVKQVLTDQQGVYVDAREFENSKYGIWLCPKGHPNPPWNLVCAVCKE